MGFEVEFNKMYQKIAQKISDIIPVNWKEFYFQGEVTIGEGGEVFWFFNTPENPEYKYCHDIPNTYGVNNKDYEESWQELYDLTVELQKLFIANDQEPWFSFDMIVNEARKLNIYYNYIDWTKTEFGPNMRLNYFEHKYFDKPPKNDKEKEAFLKMHEYEQAHSS